MPHPVFLPSRLNPVCCLFDCAVQELAEDAEREEIARRLRYIRYVSENSENIKKEYMDEINNLVNRFYAEYKEKASAVDPIKMDGFIWGRVAKTSFYRYFFTAEKYGYPQSYLSGFEDQAALDAAINGAVMEKMAPELGREPGKKALLMRREEIRGRLAESYSRTLREIYDGRNPIQKRLNLELLLMRNIKRKEGYKNFFRSEMGGYKISDLSNIRTKDALEKFVAALVKNFCKSVAN